MSERDEIIAEMREYFEQRADAEYLPGSPGGSPNKEMKMLEKLGQLQDSLESHHRDLLAIHHVASHIAGVEPPTEDDTLTVKRVKLMATLINRMSGWLDEAREQEGGEAVAFVFPDDLEKLQTTECAVNAYSVEMGDPDRGETVPLWLHQAQSQGVPEGYVLAPKSMCITQEDVGLIVMMTGWDDEDQGDAEGVLWFGLIEDDEGNRTHGLNISCSECMEEGAIQLVQFDEPNSTPAAPQQSNQDDVIALLTNALANIRDTDASAKTLQSMAALALRAAKETCDGQAAREQEGGDAVAEVGMLNLGGGGTLKWKNMGSTDKLPDGLEPGAKLYLHPPQSQGVPEEPNETMLDAGHDFLLAHFGGWDEDWPDIEMFWKTMHRAALLPTPAAPQADEIAQPKVSGGVE